MAKGYKARGGGRNLVNFEVVGNPKPTSPKPNTIWVNVNNLSGWYVSLAKPNNMRDGEVWIKVGNASDVGFNAIKKNSVLLYPIEAKQLVGDELVEVTAESYLNEQWQTWWDSYLYNEGNEYTAITGGWIVTAVGRSEGTGAEYEINKSESAITISGVSQKGFIVHPANKINLSDTQKITFTGKLTPASNAGRYSFVGVWNAFGNTNADNLVASFDVSKETEGTQEIDVSALNGEYYIGIAVHGLNSSAVLESMKLD